MDAVQLYGWGQDDDNALNILTLAMTMRRPPSIQHHVNDGVTHHPMAKDVTTSMRWGQYDETHDDGDREK